MCTIKALTVAGLLTVTSFAASAAERGAEPAPARAVPAVAAAPSTGAAPDRTPARTRIEATAQVQVVVQAEFTVGRSHSNVCMPMGGGTVTLAA
ncbi:MULTISPECIES: hypothetical protein [unclassified Streptomyces]|uniref:hypothetical protein n=1 Tax=unclassified Streptomyces TaxID=2593676 RepID=UPI002E292C51|nr:hypothetical protein [Streptomyces sp. NBC_00223]